MNDQKKELNDEKKNEKTSTFFNWCLLLSFPLAILGLLIFIYGFKKVVVSILSFAFFLFILFITSGGSGDSGNYEHLGYSSDWND